MTIITVIKHQRYHRGHLMAKLQMKLDEAAGLGCDSRRSKHDRPTDRPMRPFAGFLDNKPELISRRLMLSPQRQRRNSPTAKIVHSLDIPPPNHQYMKHYRGRPVMQNCGICVKSPIIIIIIIIIHDICSAYFLNFSRSSLLSLFVVLFRQSSILSV